MEDEIKSQEELVEEKIEESAAPEEPKPAGSEPVQPAEEPAAEPADEKPVKAPREKKPFTQWPMFGWFLNSRSAGALTGKSLLLLAIPYVYLIILCLIFDTWLKMYSAAGFILYSTIAFWIINIALIVWAVMRYTKRRKG